MPITIHLKSSNGEIVEVDEKTARCSKTISDVLDSCPAENDEIEIPLPKIHSVILHKYLQWARHHKDETPPEDNDDHLYEKTPDWDIEFLNVDHGMLMELVLAANYLNVRALLNRTTRALANKMKGKTAIEIREICYIENDLPNHEETESSPNPEEAESSPNPEEAKSSEEL